MSYAIPPQLRYVFIFPPSYTICSFSPPVKLFPLPPLKTDIFYMKKTGMCSRKVHAFTLELTKMGCLDIPTLSLCHGVSGISFAHLMP
jgi:hypothetical protein